MADSNLIDFREIVLVWAKDTAPKRLSSRSDTDYDINWGKLRINTRKAEYNPTAQKLVSSSVILSKSSIGNGTENSQDNEVVMEGSYKATNTITLTKAFTIGEQTKLDLSLPDEMVKAGFDKTLSITEIEKHLKTKEQTWKMATKVTVPPRENITVEQTITVNQYSSTFRVPTDISGKVHVTMYKTNGNEKRFLMSLEPVNIAHVMKHVEQRNKLSVPHKFWELKESSVCVTTEGECEFMYGVEQNVNTTTVQEDPTGVHPSPSGPLYPPL